MNPTAYIETSVVSYLTARPSRDVVVAGYQEVTREWWRDASARSQLVASQLVVAECEAGDADAARARLEVLQGVALLSTSAEAEDLARHLLDLGAVPRKAAADAAHIAIAAARRRVSGDMELPPHRKRGNESPNRERMQAGGLQTACHLHA